MLGVELRIIVVAILVDEERHIKHRSQAAHRR